MVFDCLLKIFLANVKISLKDYFIPNNLTKTVEKFIKKEFGNLDIQYISNKGKNVFVSLRNVNDREVNSLIEGIQMKLGNVVDEMEIVKF